MHGLFTLIGSPNVLIVVNGFNVADFDKRYFMIRVDEFSDTM